MAPKLRDLVICFSGNFGPENSSNALRRWTEQNGGQYGSEMSGETTHLVVSELNWRRQGPEIRAANKSAAKIVTYDWFENKLRLSGRIHEGKYLWSRIEEAAANEARKKRKVNEREKRRKAKEAERKEKDSRRINWGAALFEHTNEYANDEAQDAYESHFESEFKQGTKHARKDLLSDNIHVHMDETGFQYSVRLTKVHALLNRNTVVNITLYATNHTPEIYNLVVKTIGATKVDKAKAFSCKGVNYPTAFRAYRHAFKCYTGIDWEKRIAAFSGGSNPLNIRHATPVANPRDKKKDGTRKGKGKVTTTKIIESIEDKSSRFEKEFAGMKYTYHIPGPEEPRGTMPDGSHLKKKVEKSVYERFGKAKDANVIVKKDRAPEIARGKKFGRKTAPIIVLDDSDDSSSEEDESADEEVAKGSTPGAQQMTMPTAVTTTEQPDVSTNIGAEDDTMQGVETIQGPVNSIFNNPVASMENQDNNSIFNNPAATTSMQTQDSSIINGAHFSNRHNNTGLNFQPMYQSNQVVYQPTYHTNQPDYQSNFKSNFQPTYQPSIQPTYTQNNYQSNQSNQLSHQSNQLNFQPIYQPTSPRYPSLSPEATLGAFQTPDVFPTISNGNDDEGTQDA